MSALVSASFLLSSEEAPMLKKVVPMIHVPDVRATAAWYEAIGFRVDGTHEDDGFMSWALLSVGATEIMLNEGGRPSTEERREVDLYVRGWGVWNGSGYSAGGVGGRDRDKKALGVPVVWLGVPVVWSRRILLYLPFQATTVV